MRLIVDRLVRPGPAQPGGPVGGQRQQRQVPVRGLEHGRVEVGHGRSRSGDDRDGRSRAARAQAPGQPEGEEPGVALVDAHMRADQPRLGQRRQGVDQGGGAGPGGDDHIRHC